MRRSIQSHKMDEVFARLEADDRAVVYLSKLPPQVALATALSVEWSLANVWEEEQREMMRRGDPREVFPITEKDSDWLRDQVDEMPPGVDSDVDAEQHVFDLLADFPPDQAWFVAHKVAKWAANYARKEHIEVVPYCRLCWSWAHTLDGASL